MNNSIEQEFKSAVDLLELNSHGNQNYQLIAEKAEKIGKTSKILPILKSFMLKEPILWEDVKNRVWSSEKEREDNKFYFLQGDLISTSRLVTVDEARTQHDFFFCVVRQPSCELVVTRSTQRRLFRVSPCRQVLERHKKEDKDLYSDFALACRFKSPKFFAFPALSTDDPGVLGYLVYLSLPYFLKEEDAEDAVIAASLSYNGWNLFSAAIQQVETRANLPDEKILRN